jgi:hypothetical protein
VQGRGPSPAAPTAATFGGMLLLPRLIAWRAAILALAWGCAGPVADMGAAAVEVDPFLLGVNYPWLNYGNDFGSNDWGAYGVSTEVDRIDADFSAMADANIEVVRWFVFGDGRASPEFAADGAPMALEPLFWDDMDVAVDAAEAHGLQLVPVLLDFGWFASAEDVSGVQVGGHADVFADPIKRGALVDEVVLPLLQHYGDRPGILAWDLVNEPEWAMDGFGEEWLGGSVLSEDIYAFVDAVVPLVASETVHLSTVGSASALWLTQHWTDRDLTLLQVHWYGANEPAISAWDLCGETRCVIGEFGTSTDYAPVGEVLDGAVEMGWDGAWAWSYQAADEASALSLSELGAWEEQ